MKPPAVAAAILILTALSWLVFPGHTWLQQDTQIYVPMLEHLRDPAFMERDMLATQPHLAFTLYDEVALSLRRITGSGLREVLAAQQLITRALGIWGLYLMAAALGLSPPASLLAAGIVSLGATIGGPAVLSFELEPDPRGFAVPVIFLAVGLAAHGRHLASGIAGAAAFVIHPPTTLPFWAVFLCLSPRLVSLAPLAAAGVILTVAAHFQAGVAEPQHFFARLTPALESLQRMRAPYSYISEWWRAWLPHYVVFYVGSLLAYYRIRHRTPRDLRFFLLGLPLIGMLSVPISYLLLEKLHWALLPQGQPMRALLFVTVIAQFSAAAAAIFAAELQRYLEAFAWFALAYFVPVNTNVLWLPDWRRALVVALLAAAACLAARFKPALAAVAAVAFFLIPTVGGVTTHPNPHTPELAQLSEWARSATPRDAVFLFPDAGRALYPGVFRAEAQRAVYVDWKSGGQINYFPRFAEQWWSRWQQTMAASFDPRDMERYRALGIDYVIVHPAGRLAARSPAFQNDQYLSYKTGN